MSRGALRDCCLLLSVLCVAPGRCEARESVAGGARPLRRQTFSHGLISTEFRMREIWFAEQVARLQGVGRTPEDALPGDDAPWQGITPWLDAGDSPAVAELKARERALRSGTVTRSLEPQLRYLKGGREAPEGLVVHPQLLEGFFSGWVCWEGDFEAPVAGVYRFAVHGRFGALLEVGGHPVAMVPFRQSPGRWDECVEGQMRLEAGLHGLRFLVQGRRETLLANAAVRVPGEAHFRALGGSFFPGLTVDPLKATPEATSAPWVAHAGSSLAVDMASPALIFSDEVLDARLAVTAVAACAQEVTVALWRMSSSGGCVASNGVTRLLPPPPIPLFDPGEPAPSLALHLPLPGSVMGPGERIHWRVVADGHEIEVGSVQVRPAADVGKLSADGTGLHDADGERVLLRLSRPSLTERRRWSLPKRLAASLRKPHAWLVIGDDFGVRGKTLYPALTAAFATRGLELDALAWPLSEGGGVTQQGLPAVVRAMQAESYDAVLILPSSFERECGDPVRDRTRALAVVMEAACSRFGREQVWVARPLPSAVPDGRDDDWVSELDRETAAYGVRRIPLDAWIVRNPAWRDAYRAEDGSLARHPLRLTEDIAEYLTDVLQ